MSIYNDLKSQLEAPTSLRDIVPKLDAKSCAAVFVPGGHGAMLGISDDPNVGTLLH